MQEEFEQIRNAELAEVQRLEAAEKRRHEEKERRMAQERGRLQRERAVQQKVASRAYAKKFLGGLRGSVFSNLWEKGHFFDPVVKEVEDSFIPWLSHSCIDSFTHQFIPSSLTFRVIPLWRLMDLSVQSDVATRPRRLLAPKP